MSYAGTSLRVQNIRGFNPADRVPWEIENWAVKDANST